MKQNESVVNMRIEEYITKTHHNGRRGSSAIPSGTLVHVIKYVGLPGYATYSFINRTDAQNYIDGSVRYNTNTYRYYGFNMVREPELTLHVGSKSQSDSSVSL